MSKLPANVVKHIHGRADVTVERVAAFVKADPSIQLSVLAELRRRTADDSGSVEIAFGGAGLALIAFFIVPRSVFTDELPILATIVLALLIGFFTVVALLPIFGPPLLRSRRRADAAVWLAAFEDAQARAWAARGRVARRWQRERSIPM